MKTTNELLLEFLIAHQIELLRLSNSMVRGVVLMLDTTEAKLRQLVELNAERLAGYALTDGFSKRKLRSLLDAVEELRGGALDEVLSAWSSELRGLVVVESRLLAAKVKGLSLAKLDMSLPLASTLRTLVSTSPIEGRTLREWIGKTAVDDADRIVNQVRIGVIRGESAQNVARRVIGSSRLFGTDGVTARTRMGVAAITRTAVASVAGIARDETIQENEDLFRKELFVATLDSRTTAQCRSLDGKVYDLGIGPAPPLHFHCRSLRVPALDGGAVGTRPFKTSTERQLLDEFSPGTRDRDALPRGMKGEFDAFARKRVRELTGTVPATTTYQEFLRGQSAAFQDEVLGKAKGKLFRAGGLTLENFVGIRGNELTLKQLVLRHKSAFEAAGLDPEDFL